MILCLLVFVLFCKQVRRCFTSSRFSRPPPLPLQQSKCTLLLSDPQIENRKPICVCVFRNRHWQFYLFIFPLLTYLFTPLEVATN